MHSVPNGIVNLSPIVHSLGQSRTHFRSLVKTFVVTRPASFVSFLGQCTFHTDCHSLFVNFKYVYFIYIYIYIMFYILFLPVQLLGASVNVFIFPK